MFGLHLDERVEHHWPAAIKINLEIIIARVLPAIGIVAVNFELLDPRAGRRFVINAFLDLTVCGQGKFSHLAILWYSRVTIARCGVWLNCLSADFHLCFLPCHWPRRCFARPNRGCA